MSKNKKGFIIFRIEPKVPKMERWLKEVSNRAYFCKDKKEALVIETEEEMFSILSKVRKMNYDLSFEVVK
jgi:hypothetical protein